MISRCHHKRVTSYKWYGGKGVRVKMSFYDLAYLWKRDKANNLDRPSIDRIDSGGNYELKNCRFIELSENVRRAHMKPI